MPIVYVRRAVRDLSRIAEFIAANDGNYASFLRRLRAGLERHYAIRNPGIAGRMSGTTEWMLRPLPYMAVVTWDGDDVTVHRVLPTAVVTRPRA